MTLGAGLFGGILYLQQWYDRRASVIFYLCNRESKGNGNQHGCKDVCMCSGCDDILMTILKHCLQSSTEAKIDINLDILRNIVEVIEDGILVKICWKKNGFLLKILRVIFCKNHPDSPYL